MFSYVGCASSLRWVAVLCILLAENELYMHAEFGVLGSVEASFSDSTALYYISLSLLMPPCLIQRVHISTNLVLIFRFCFQ